MDDMHTPDQCAPLPNSGVGGHHKAPEEWEPQLPAPAELVAAEQIFHPKHGLAAMRWVYRDASGAPLFAVVRFNLPDGGKETLPYTFGRRVWTDKAGERHTRTGWHFKRPHVPVPLYGLDRLAARPEAPVLVLEGEKTADAASVIFPDHVCVTSQGGANAAGHSDWTTLHRRHVTIWPDRDEPGAGYAAEVAEAAQLAGAVLVRTVIVPTEWPGGWDLADPLPDGVDDGRLVELMASAPENKSGAGVSGDSEPRPLFRALPIAEPYPVEAMGDALRRVVEAVHLRTQAPMAICAQSVLGTVSLAVQGLADIALPTGEVKPCGLFLLTVAGSGERKSACDSAAGRGITLHKKELREEYDAALPDYMDRKEAWEKAKAEASGVKQKTYAEKLAAIQKLGPAPEPPLSPVLTTDEGTPEGLFKLLQNGQPSAGLIAPEAAAFLGGHGMTEEAKARMAAMLSHLWDGSDLHRVRAGDGAIILHGRRLTTHLMAQPSVAAMLTQDALIAGDGGQGLVNRFLIVAPDSAAGTRLFRDPGTVADKVLEEFADTIATRLAAPLPMVDGKRNELMPRALPLSADARNEWIRFQHASERELAKGGRLELVRGLGNKLPEHATRLAAVLTLFNDPDAMEISLEAMGSGIALATYYAGEAVRLAEWATVAIELQEADKVRLWLHETWPHGAISLPDLYQRGPANIRSLAAAKAVVDTLLDHGQLREIKGGAVVAGRKRRQAWAIIGKVGQ